MYRLRNSRVSSHSSVLTVKALFPFMCQFINFPVGDGIDNDRTGHWIGNWRRHSIVYDHPPPMSHFAPPPRLLIDFKNSKWLTNFALLFSPDWLIFCYMIISLV